MDVSGRNDEAGITRPGSHQYLGGGPVEEAAIANTRREIRRQELSLQAVGHDIIEVQESFHRDGYLPRDGTVAKHLAATCEHCRLQHNVAVLVDPEEAERKRLARRAKERAWKRSKKKRR